MSTKFKNEVIGLIWCNHCSIVNLRKVVMLYISENGNYNVNIIAHMFSVYRKVKMPGGKNDDEKI